MHPMLTISLAGSLLTIACSLAHAQHASPTMNLEGDFVLPASGVDYPISMFEKSDPLMDRFSLIELNEFRVAGFDLAWIADPFVLPRFNPQLHHRVLQADDLLMRPVTIESLTTQYADAQGMQLNDSVRFSVGRTTELRDGNISGNAGVLNTGAANEHISSLTQSEGEYDVYDLALEWEAISAGPVTLSVLSGLKAIEANIGKRVTKDNDTTIERVNRVAAVPMIGSGLRWQINESFSFSSAALTHPTQAGDALIDFNASTDLRLSTNVMFSAGYRVLRSSFEVGAVETDIDQKGLFARIEISF